MKESRFTYFTADGIILLSLEGSQIIITPIPSHFNFPDTAKLSTFLYINL
jgi:hypothetical protein